MTAKPHRLAIQVLLNKVDEYSRTITEGRYVYHDPEEEIAMFERMRDQLKETIKVLHDLQDQEELSVEVVVAVRDSEIIASPYTLSPAEQAAIDARFDHLRKSKDKPSKS